MNLPGHARWSLIDDSSIMEASQSRCFWLTVIGRLEGQLHWTVVSEGVGISNHRPSGVYCRRSGEERRRQDEGRTAGEGEEKNRRARADVLS